MIFTQLQNRKIALFFRRNLNYISLAIVIFSISSANAQTSTSEKAKSVAIQFLSSQNKQKSLINSTIAIKEVYHSLDKTANPMYCFQSDNSGFVFVSENNGNCIVVGYSQTGIFNTSAIPDAMTVLLKAYEQGQINPNYNTQKGKRGANSVSPLLDTKGISLNQYSHENVGNCYTGCVATAMAQIMCYYKYPANGKDSNCYVHPVYGKLCADFEHTTYDWTKMNDTLYKLISYQLGVAMNMNYCGSSYGSSPSSPTYLNTLQKNFRYFIEKGNTESFYIMNELDNNRPVYCELPGDPGHAMVVDGYDTAGYFHINFGWGGASNGYFLLNTNNTMNVGYTFGTNISAAVYASPTPYVVNQQDSLALVAFHNSMGAKTGWDMTTPVSNWNGVIVMNGRVISLILSNALEGTIPPEIGNLTELQHFSIRGIIYGSFPLELTTLTKLKELDINYYTNSTSAILPVEIGNLVNLESLNLTPINGQTTGAPMPSSIGKLTKLKSLSLRNGILTGSISDSIYNLINLEELILDNNQLTGNFTSKIGGFAKLKKIYIHNNQFSGALPSEIGNLTEMTEFRVSNNKFTGTIPESIGNWTKLQSLYIDNNAFQGMVPNAIAKFTSFTDLTINNNHFSALPDSIGNLTNLQQIVANHNMIDSIPSSISKLSKLYRLDLMNNRLTTLPNMGTMPALWDLNLANNRITSLPETFGTLAKVQELNLDSNKLTLLPASFQYLSTLQSVSIKTNNLISLPITFSLLGNLKHIYVNSNRISGNLPPLSHLGLLDLWVQNNNLTFEDFAASKMPDDSVYTDDYTFLYYNQGNVALTDSTFTFADGDSVKIDIQKISKMSHPNNIYTWYKGTQQIQTGAVLKIANFGAANKGTYTCHISNSKYKRNQCELITYPIVLISKDDSINAYGYQTSSRSNTNHEFSDHQVMLVTPTEVRGDHVWQASTDSIHWYTVSDTMSQQQIKQNILSVNDARLLIAPKSQTIFRYVVKEGTCNPIISDAVKIKPYGRLLVDTTINVTGHNITIARDSIEVIIPANFTTQDFRLTIEKLNNPPAAPDSIQLSSVYDVNLSCGTVFDVPLQIKFKNINKKLYNDKDKDKYKATYYDDKNQKWVAYDNSDVSVKDSTIVFNTYHLTKLAWFEFAHGSYTHIYTYGRVNVIYKYGVGGEDNFYQAYALGVKKEPVESWQNSNTDPATNGNPLMIQDIAEYANEVITKFDDLGLETPSLRFNVYVGILNKGAAGMTDAGSYLAGRGYLYIDPTYCTERAPIKTTLAHEYMHFTQDYYMVMLTQNYFWAEAHAPLSDRLVWNDTELETAEPELLLEEARMPSKSGKMIFDVLSESWDNYTNLPIVSKLVINSGDANLASTFLHYMRSYRTGDKLQPDVLLKETTYLGSWLGYLDSYIQKYLKSKVGDEFDAFVKYIVEGSNPKFTLLNTQAGEDPLKYFQNTTAFIENKIFKINTGQVPLKDSVHFEVPYLGAKMVQMFNINDNQKVVVKYKRKYSHTSHPGMKVYVCKYDADAKKMTFDDITEKDSSAFVIDKPDVDKLKKTNITYLLFINTETTRAYIEDYEFKVYSIPEYSMFDYFGFTAGAGSTELKIHSISDGTSETLDEMYMMPSVFRVYAAQYYSPMSYSDELTDSTYISHANSLQIDQTVTYNFLTGRMTIYDKEDWGGTGINPPVDIREFTMSLENVWLTPLPANQYGLTFTFQTANTAETQKVVKSISYTRKYKIWNDQLTPPSYNPLITYTYIRTNYNTNDIKFHMQFY